MNWETIAIEQETHKRTHQSELTVVKQEYCLKCYPKSDREGYSFKNFITWLKRDYHLHDHTGRTEQYFNQVYRYLVLYQRNKSEGTLVKAYKALRHTLWTTTFIPAPEYSIEDLTDLAILVSQSTSHFFTQANFEATVNACRREKQQRDEEEHSVVLSFLKSQIGRASCRERV